jgi:hypothetical protein
MEKINSSVEKAIRLCVSHIAEETHYDFVTMNDIVTKWLNKDENISQCQASVPSGRQCSNLTSKNSKFCKRHTFFKPQLAKCQCIALTKNGTRCVRDAKLQPGEETALCGLHIGKDRRDSRKAESKECIYYDETDDVLTFCGNPSVDQQWCCIEHKHLEANNKKTFKFANLSAYVNNKSNPEHVPHPIIEKRLECV